MFLFARNTLIIVLILLNNDTATRSLVCDQHADVEELNLAAQSERGRPALPEANIPSWRFT